MARNRAGVLPADGLFQRLWPAVCITAILFLVFFVSTPARAGRLVEGIADGQLFPYRTYQAEIPFRAKGLGPLNVRVVDDFSEKAVAWGSWVVVRSGEDEATPTPGSDEPLRTSSRDLRIPAVPIGGAYTIEFTRNGVTETYKNILVGEVWIVAGGINAAGARSGKQLDPIPWVRVFRNGRWDDGSDPAVSGTGVSRRWVTPWLRVAQNFYQYQGIPVGLLGYTAPGKPIDAFVDSSGRLTDSWRSLLGRHAAGASTLIWWQGEADALDRDTDDYAQRLRQLTQGVRQTVGRDDLMAVVIQLGRHNIDSANETPYFGRIREQQRRFVLTDSRAILMPGLPYPVSGSHQITGSGVQSLGITLAGVMRKINTTGKVHWQGPKPARVSFIDRSGFRRVRIEFEGDQKLVLDKGGESQWLITDSKHQGYPEIIGPARIENGQVRFAVRGASLGSLSRSDGNRDGAVRLENAGYVGVIRVSLAKSDTEVVLDLKEPAEIGGKLHYCLMDDARTTVRSTEGGYLAAFSDITIEKAPEQF